MTDTVAPATTSAARPLTDVPSHLELSPDEAQEFVRYVETRFHDLLRIVAKVAAGDFSEKPEIHEREDELSRFVVGFRFMIEDVERARLEEDARRRGLEEANAKLRELNELRTRFINNAAHELNTPLTPLKIELYNLRQEGQIPTSALASLALIERSVDRLARLVEDLLDASRLQSDRMRLVATKVDVGVLVAEAIGFYEAAAKRAGVTIAFHRGALLETHADAVRLSQVFYNLLSNAIKFTPRGGRVRCDAGRTGDTIVIHVRDSGLGLSEEQISRLFQPFGQAHESIPGVPRGNGLGLFISRGMVELHGGQIRCSSAGPGKGTTFSVQLPYRVSPPSP